MAAARIGRVRLKNGGAEVRVLHRETPNAEGKESWAGALMAGARTAVEHANESAPICGYVLVAFYADGCTWTSHRWGDESPMNRAMLPHLVAEIVRRDVITDREARSIFDEMFERV